ncbi:MAG: nucleoside hydrolase [Candidatus Hinthialibacter sp.]
MPIPMIYTTDLYHPHQDPDDHFDLATLFAMREFDIRAIVIDRGEGGADRPGTIAVHQMEAITRRRAPCALGMIQDVPWHGYIPESELDGVNLIIDALRRSEQPVTIFTTGSLRDMTAAYLREPELFQRRVGRLYINAGHSSGKEEWNVKLEPGAYFRMLRARLPIFWMPCFGDGGFQTYWNFRQGDVLERAPLAVQNFIVYALSQTSPTEVDPIQALERPIPGDVKKKFWNMKRNMWCTAGFLHAAGRKNDAFSFLKKRVVLDESAQTTALSPNGGVELWTFHQTDAEAYAQSMTAALRDLLAGLAP